MEYRGYDFYDQDENFARYMERRKGQENANDTLEKPVFLELLGEVRNQKVLDLGCGDARFAQDLFDRGCGEYVGLEGSANMAQAAAIALNGSRGHVIQTAMESWHYPADTFDLAVSRLAIHYIELLDPLLIQLNRTLKTGGRLIFSVEHPVITSTLQPAGVRTNWVVDQYFVEGYRKQEWLGGTVMKYHRTVEQYFTALQRAGFQVEQLRESAPQRQHFVTEETYARRLRIPLFLFLSARKQ